MYMFKETYTVYIKERFFFLAEWNRNFDDLYELHYKEN